MITSSDWVIIIQMITAAVVVIAGYITRREVIGLKPEIVDVRKKLDEANAFIAQQVNVIQELRDFIAEGKPIVSKRQFDSDYNASPPYTKPLPKT